MPNSRVSKLRLVTNLPIICHRLDRAYSQRQPKKKKTWKGWSCGTVIGRPTFMWSRWTRRSWRVTYVFTAVVNP